jgi:hypothetical protein
VLPEKLMRLAIIIPSRTISNLVQCVEAVRLFESSKMPIVVVADDLDPGAVDPVWWRDHDPLDFAQGEKPFVYARNVNIGIRTAASLYVPQAFILLNDDALLRTPGGFTELAKLAEKHPDYGIISAVTNFVGNILQQPQHVGFREELRMLCFIAVLITAETFIRVGELDERFTAYGWDDNDFCRRCRQAGLRLGISDNCFVDHTTLPSSFRGQPGGAPNIAAGAAIYREKWGNLL